MVTYERRVGRLVEIRVRGERDVSQFGRVFALANELGPGAKVIICNDARGAAPLSAEDAGKLATLMLATRERVEHAVTLVGERELALRQAERVRGEARTGHPVVRTPAEAIAALEPVLNPAELARLKQFLSEP